VPSQFPGVPVEQLPNNSADGAENGLHTLAHSTAASINCAFVRLSTSVGQDKVIALAKQMGLTQGTLQKVLNLSIGTIEATPLEMATVMATIANNGLHHDPVFVQKVLNPDGTTLIDNSSRPGEQVLTPEVAQCEQNVMRTVITGGTGGAAAVGGQTPYGKTGTTDHTTDAWFIGAVPQLATSVWFGYRASAVGGAGYGGDSSAPIFSAFMSQALEGQVNIPLPNPGPVCARPGQYANPDGGRSAPQVIAPPVVPDQPTVQQLPTTPTARAVTPGPTPGTTPPGTVPSTKPGNG
ncbi:MAG: penicillin-binding transpeptidase domain-containing protein, partial [Acidimicrobiia bacterium]